MPIIKNNRKTTIYSKECKVKNAASNFVKVTKNSKISKELTSGNKALDYVLTSKIAKRTPVVGGLIKAFNYGETGGAYIARGKATYDESCKRRK